MKIVRQSAPVIRTENIAGINEGIWQPYFEDSCDFYKKLSDTTKSFCLVMAGCDAPQLMV